MHLIILLMMPTLLITSPLTAGLLCVWLHAQAYPADLEDMVRQYGVEILYDICSCAERVTSAHKRHCIRQKLAHAVNRHGVPGLQGQVIKIPSCIHRDDANRALRCLCIRVREKNYGIYQWIREHTRFVQPRRVSYAAKMWNCIRIAKRWDMRQEMQQTLPSNRLQAPIRIER